MSQQTNFANSNRNGVVVATALISIFEFNSSKYVQTYNKFASRLQCFKNQFQFLWNIERRTSTIVCIHDHHPIWLNIEHSSSIVL